MKREIQVVCGVFYRKRGSDFEIPLFQRTEEPQVFEFPGGKIEPGEDDETALKRELKEELNVNVEVINLIGENRHEYDNLIVNLRAYWVREVYDAPVFQLVDHSTYEWIAGVDAKGLPVSGADIPFLKEIFEEKARPKT